MPQNYGGQDAAVAVLQAQQSTLEVQNRELAKSVNEGFAAINAKIDRISDIAIAITQMSARQEAHSEGLSRAFNEIKGTHEALDRSVAEMTQWRDRLENSIDERFDVRDKSRTRYHDEHAGVHAEIERRLTLARGLVLGISLTYGVVLALVVWIAVGYLEDTGENRERIHQLELNEARAHPRTP